jgi:hypothetical protein
LRGGVDVGHASDHIAPGFQGTILETIEGSPARVWTYTSSSTDAHRGQTTYSLFAADQVDLTPTLTLDAAFRLDGVNGSAKGAGTGVSWLNLLPRVGLRWTDPGPKHIGIFTSYTRTADTLTFDKLAVGDPAAPVGVYRANDSLAGPVVSRIGPGTGGDPAFSAISPDLARPVTDEFVIGIESRPRAGMRFSFSGIAKRQSNLLRLVNVGAPLSSYSTLDLADPGLDLAFPEDDQVLTIYNRLPATFGQDRYLLTNASDASKSGALVLSAHASTRTLDLLFGMTAGIQRIPAASRGFHAIENDTGVLGELLTNPNAAIFGTGKPFSDRGYTAKLALVYRFAHDTTVGTIVRYQDGQAFARMVVVPGLTQGTEVVRAYANGGSLFTFTGTVDVRVRKGFLLGATRFDAFADAYNLVNMFEEVEEHVVTGPAFRSQTALQPPFAMHFGVRLTF